MSIKIEISSTVWIFHASGFFNHFNLGTTSPVGSCRFVPVVILCWYAAKAKAPPVFSSQTSSTFVHPMTASSASWKEVYAFSLVSLHRPIFNAHWAECVSANGLRADTNFPDVTSPSWWPIPACRSSIQSTCHSCQWQDTEKWIPKRRCILTVAAAIHRKEAAYLQWAASISFTWEKKRQPETKLGTTCPDRSLYSLLAYPPWARAKHLATLNVYGSAGGKRCQSKRPKQERIRSNFDFRKVYSVSVTSVSGKKSWTL